MIAIKSWRFISHWKNPPKILGKIFEKSKGKSTICLQPTCIIGLKDSYLLQLQTNQIMINLFIKSICIKNINYHITTIESALYTFPVPFRI